MKSAGNVDGHYMLYAVTAEQTQTKETLLHIKVLSKNRYLSKHFCVNSVMDRLRLYRTFRFLSVT